jgi:hypothetical protein
MLLGALQDADAQELRTLFLARSPLEERMVEAIVTRAEAEKRFRAAVQKAYGQNGAGILVNDTEAHNAASIAQIDSADEKIEGDRAFVAAGQGSEMQLLRADGRWKVPVSELATSPAEREAAAAAAQQGPGSATQPGAAPPATGPTGDGIAGREKAIEQRLDDEKLAVQIMNDVSSEIDQGKYKTPQEARDAIQMKMMVEAMKRYGATQPAPGAPAAPPATEPSKSS